MKPQKRLLALAMTCLLAGFSSSSISAQTSSQGMGAVQTRLNQIKNLLGKVPVAQKKRLSVAALNLLQVSDNWATLAQGGPQIPIPQRPAAVIHRSISGSPLIPVSNPATDLKLSLTTGFTQSETSTAWCGSNVVVGFNDSGSLWETLPGFLSGTSGLSFSGVSFSNDSAASFTDAGFVNPGPNPANFVVGDPVVACTTPNAFFYAQLLETTDSLGHPLTAVGFSTSTDGGATWGDPTAAVSKDGTMHFLDKDWMTVDPNHPNIFYVTYTDFDFSGFFGLGPCPNTIRTAIELARSTDGGVSWSAPVVVVQFCDTNFSGSIVQGSQVAVASDGAVYVSWEQFSGATGAIREIDLAKSTTHGERFTAPTKVTDVVYIGDGGAVQGGIRNNEFPSLAIDRSATAKKGRVYIAWADGRNMEVPDLAGAAGFYGYADIFLTRSLDGGSTWSAPTRVNTNPESSPTDQFEPALAVDSTGAVGACWYDRSRDPLNFWIDRTCGVSTNGGEQFSNHLDTPSSFPPFHATDLLINPFYLGDYDSLASDNLRTTTGFIGAFSVISHNGNPDVFAVKH